MRGDWRLTSFWGYSDSARRRQSWNLLRDLASMSSDPWCIIGDFNDLLSSEDKRGGPERLSWLYNGFRNAVSDCSLLDMPLEGYQYTWFKSLGTNRALEERLDRAMHTHAWSLMFPEARLINLVAATSNHSPILLKLEHEPYIQPKRSFRFENAWLLDNNLVDMITSNWPCYPASNIPQKLKYCISDMEAWSKENSPNFRVAANKLRRELELIRSTHDHLSDATVSIVQNKLSNVLLQEDRYWKQRAKVYWLIDGDKNSKFFHASASARKKRNAIKKLRDTNDVLVEDQSGLCNIARDYFQNLFVPNHGDHAPIVATIPQRVTDIDNETLTSPFTEEEFHGHFPPNINDTNIALVAKVDRPESMKDLRPISLCNVVYKILSKVLANRLKRIFPTCISYSQAAFVPGRDILDNAVTTFEVLHYMKCKSRGKEGLVALKLDVSKAFDRVKWSYLQAVMQKMGFSDTWVKWIMQCVTTVNYHVLLNNDWVGPITALCGLRQGDPLSPYFSLSVNGEWRKIWDMRLPPKLKHFCWRLLRGCLPTRFNLHRRGVQCQTICALCNNATEDELHLFTDCANAILCWKEVNLWQSLEHQFLQSGSFSSIIFSIISSMEETKQSLFAAVLWSIWRARNECIWENKQANPVASCRLAFDLIRDFNWCHNMLNAYHMPTHVHTWEKPLVNWLKCNVDGAIFTTEAKFGIGICFRDSSGSFVQAHTMTFPFEVTAVECEATAMKHALALALSNAFERVLFESDCQQVMNALRIDYLYALLVLFCLVPALSSAW
ncbi:hypothetical protein TSUD_280940 [Trifolium subterraneum]|uniref:Reverse transcriptase domain-containing protein n=1 Tax=Trifolium subterraneum TaxID=3900 RepID=A0A2Z6NT03_TRISU|nr:hypothetical protein TSUD_280940 [Trifolium subterraneum]